MDLRFAVVVAALSVTASGCRSALQTRSLSRIPPMPSEVVRLPAANADAEAQVGSSMLSATKRTACPGIKLADPITHRDTRYSTWFQLKIPRGVLYAMGSDRDGTFYEAVEPIELVQTSDGFSSRVRGGVFVPTAAPAATELYWIPADDTPFNVDHPGIPFERVTVDLRTRRELVYGGASQSTITVVYRELVDGVATPGSSQELKYDLSRGDVIEYREARLQVISATAEAIRYRVLAPLE